MQVTVNKDLDSYKDDFFKGLTLKQTAISIISVAAGTGTYFFASYVLKLDQTICFYLALPVVLPIAAGGFLRIHGMTPALYLKRRRETVCRDAWFFSPDFCLLEEEGSRIRAKERIWHLDAEDGNREEAGCAMEDVGITGKEAMPDGCEKHVGL